MGSRELRELFNANGFDDEVIRLAEIGHAYWREHKWENDPRMHKVHLEATPTFWNMNGSAMDMFLMIAKGIRAAQPDTLRERLEGLPAKWYAREREIEKALCVNFAYGHFSECAQDLKDVLASAPTLASLGVGEPWLFAIEEHSEDGRWSWHDGEQCVFADLASAQDEVDSLNDGVEDWQGSPYQVVPLYRTAAPPAQGAPAPPVEARADLLIRCRDCGGTLLYEETAEGYEVIHSCHAGKQVREMVQAAEQAIGRRLEEKLPCGHRRANEVGDEGGTPYCEVCKAEQAALEQAALLVKSTEIVYRYTPFPHNKGLVRNAGKELAAAIRALAPSTATAQPETPKEPYDNNS
jgi:hypothetical protein